MWFSLIGKVEFQNGVSPSTEKFFKCKFNHLPKFSKNPCKCIECCSKCYIKSSIEWKLLQKLLSYFINTIIPFGIHLLEIGWPRVYFILVLYIYFVNSRKLERYSKRILEETSKMLYIFHSTYFLQFVSSSPYPWRG